MAKRRKSSKRKSSKRKRSTKKRRKTTKRRKSSKKRKGNKRKRSTKKKRKMARKTGGKKSLIDKIPLLNNKTVQKIGFGLGMGALAGIIINFIPVPAIKQNAEIIKTGVTFAADPIAGLLKVSGLLGGGGLNLSGLTGGNSANGTMSTRDFA